MSELVDAAKRHNHDDVYMQVRALQNKKKKQTTILLFEIVIFFALVICGLLLSSI